MMALVTVGAGSSDQRLFYSSTLPGSGQETKVQQWPISYKERSEINFAAVCTSLIAQLPIGILCYSLQCEGAKLVDVHLSGPRRASCAHTTLSCTKLFNQELGPDYLLHQSFYTGQLLTHKSRKKHAQKPLALTRYKMPEKQLVIPWIFLAQTWSLRCRFHCSTFILFHNITLFLSIAPTCTYYVLSVVSIWSDMCVGEWIEASLCGGSQFASRML